MLDGCWVSMLLSQGLYHTWQVAGLLDLFLMCKNHLELSLDIHVKTLKF
jgi:hypothetical protein